MGIETILSQHVNEKWEVASGKLRASLIFDGFNSETNYHRAIIISGQHKILLSTNCNRQHMAHLAFQSKAIDRSRGKYAVAFVNEDGPEISIIPAHLDIIIVIISHEQYVRQPVIIMIYYRSIPQWAELCQGSLMVKFI